MIRLVVIVFFFIYAQGQTSVARGSQEHPRLAPAAGYAAFPAAAA